MTKALDRYRELRHDPKMCLLPEKDFPYNLSQGEMNPFISGGFFADLNNGARIWEPFANPDGRTFEAAAAFGHELVANSIIPGHPNLVVADSTKKEPEGLFDAVLFHPPYYGTRPFTSEERDLSNANNHDYRRRIESAADISMLHLKNDGLVCTVGRRYRHGGQEVRLDEWLVGAFGKRMVPVVVWTSEPDIVIIFEFDKNQED